MAHRSYESARGSTELVVPRRNELAVPEGFGPAAARFARNMLKKSEQTQATYRSIYRRFGDWLADHEGIPATYVRITGRDEHGRPEYENKHEEGGPLSDARHFSELEHARLAKEHSQQQWARIAGDAPLRAFTADTFSEYLDELEGDRSIDTVRKERSALRRLAKYLHQVGAINAVEILMVEGIVEREGDIVERPGLEHDVWRRVKHAARARLSQEPTGRTSREAALRDLAIVLCMGEMGLRNGEVRNARRAGIKSRRADGVTPWLHIEGKGRKKRQLPIPPEVERALFEWIQVRDELFGLDDPLLFPRLGRRRADGTFPDAGGPLSGRGMRDIVRPVMVAAGVPAEHAHPHVLRHTYGSLYMSRPKARIDELSKLMGHASIETTKIYVHKTAEQMENAVLENIAYADDALLASARRRHRRAAARVAA